jgi:hypothetical protein
MSNQKRKLAELEKPIVVQVRGVKQDTHKVLPSLSLPLLTTQHFKQEPVQINDPTFVAT